MDDWLNPERLPQAAIADASDGDAYPVAPARPRNLPQPPMNGLTHSLERPRLQLYLAKVVADTGVLLFSFAVCSTVYLGTILDLGQLSNGMLPAYLLLPLYLTIALYNGSYSRAGLTDWKLSSRRAITALLVSAALLNFLAFFAKMNEDFSRVVFTAGMVLTAVLMAAYRLALSRRIGALWGRRASNRLVIQAGGPVMRLSDAIVIDAEGHGLLPDRDDPAALDRLSRYLRNMDEVVVSCADADRRRWAEVLKGTGIRGEVVYPAAQEIGALGIERYEAAGLSTLLVSTGQLGIRARAMKRIFDLAVSAAALVLLSPLLAVLALLIKLEDGGPVFFRQRRMGRGNSFFDILKFRTMRETDDSGARSVTREDKRVTRIGRFLRRTSMDELPQLLNVLRGEMAVVGPRPHALGSQAGDKLFWQVDPEYWQRHSLRPGMTGLAQIRGYRGATERETDLTDRLRSDLEYLRGWSIWRDFAIVLATLRVLVHPRAY